MEEKPQKVNLEIDIRKLIHELWINRRLLIRIIALALAIGLIVALSIPGEYTCIVKMAPENNKSSMSNVMSLAAIAGINLGTENTDGINLSIYPDIVYSIPFISELIKMQVLDTKADEISNLYQYLDKKIKEPWWKTIIKLPFKLLDFIRNGKKENNDKILNIYHLSRQQDKIFKALQERIIISIDKKTGIITAGVTMQDPVIAATVADSLVSKLEQFIIDYRTDKARLDLAYATRMFNEASQKYYAAQENYAQYLDKNKNIILESVRIEQERLMHEQSLAYSIYSTIAQQVETARLKVQEQTPCVTIIEPARIPVRKSNASRLLILFITLLLGMCYGVIKISRDHVTSAENQ
ncbi:MAG: chain-length determining protein [Bacteroidales bacterium]|nr:chain-length determining protein [Bacteroidales bacterium]